MAGLKKRVAGPQNVTLHRFFDSGSRPAPLPARKRARCESMSREQTRARRTGLTAADAIVIDDSDDVPQEVKEIKGAVSSEPLECEAVEEEPLVFRQPSRLLEEHPRESHPAPRTLETKVECTNLSLTSCVKEPTSRSQSASETGKIDTIEGDWALGDDEVVDDNGDDYGDNVEDLTLDELKSSPGGCERACPICGMSIAGLMTSEIDRHVNDCIDASSKKMESPANKPVSNDPMLSSSKNSGPSSQTANMFSVLMSGHKENEAWKEAVEAEDKSFRPSKANGGRRKAPFYKVLPGMPIAVDAFRYGKIPGVMAYFLSHAHSDHYTNLSSSWKNGPIYCSITTANLIAYMLGVDRKWLHPLPNDVATVIPNSGGVTVTVIEANHCPGSSLFLFEGLQTVNAGDSSFASPYIGSKRAFRYLHCGDFRASPQHILHPAIRGKKIDQVYLDTTYLNPKYCFPPQPMVIDACADLARRIVNGEHVAYQEGSDENKPGSMDNWVKSIKSEEPSIKAQTKEKVLVVIGTYSIGKERIVKAVAKALDSKIYCDPRKTQLLLCQDDTELHDLLTDDPRGAIVHVVPLQTINSDKFADYVDRWGGFTKAVGFRPTGWTYTPPAGFDTSPTIPFVISRDQRRTFTYASLKPMRNSTDKLMLYGVPYSEHSSFFELCCFALSFDWVKMIATVNVGSAVSRGKMAKWFEKWDSEKRKEHNGVDKTKEGVVNYRRVDYW